MKSENQKNIYLLAEGCLKRGNIKEARALLELSDKLKIDFLHETENGKKLFNLAVNKFDSDFIVELARNIISFNDNENERRKEVLKILIENKKWNEINGILSSPGKFTNFTWNDIKNNKDILSLALDNDWENTRENLKKYSTPASIEKLENYRKNSMWLTSKNKTEFLTNAPKHLNENEVLSWWVAMNSTDANTKKESWQLDVFDMHKSWEKWDSKHVQSVIDAQKVGGIFYHYPLTAYNSSKQSDTINKMQKVIISKIDFSNKEAIQNFISKEVLLASKIRKIPLHSVGVWGIDDAINKSHVLKKWGKSLDKILESLENEKSHNFKNEFMGGVLNALNYHLLMKSTSLSDRAVNIFENAKNPRSFQELLLYNYIDSNTFESVLDIHDITIVGFHILKALESKPEEMKYFATSMLSYIQDNKEDDEVYCRMITQWADNQSKQACDKSKGVWAGLFWKNVFNISSANQHQYLKKAAKNKNLQSKLDFWDLEFAQKIEKQTKSRKRTKDISVVLTKMNLINSIALNVDFDDKPKKRTRKM